MKFTGPITELVLVALILLLLISSCGPKHQFETREGKKKLNYYNSIQYDQHKAKKYKKG